MSVVTEWKANSLADLPMIARSIIIACGHPRPVLLHGEMGAGKTTFSSAFCSALGCTVHVSSPTFSLVNIYPFPGGEVYHFDLYRLRSVEEIFALGWEEYEHSGQWMLVEWPEKIAGFEPTDAVHVYISVEETGVRRLKIALPHETL